LDIKFQNQKVKNLTVSKIVIWNSGDITINKTDIVAKDNLRIAASSNVSILDSSIIQSNEDSNNFSIRTVSANELEINFDYIDSSQGCVIQIIHDGSRTTDIELKGKIKGIKKFKNVETLRLVARFGLLLPITKNSNLNRKISGVFLITLCVLLLTLKYFGFLEQEQNTKPSDWPIYIALIPYLLLGIALLFRWVPKSLDAFNEKI